MAHSEIVAGTQSVVRFEMNVSNYCFLVRRQKESLSG
jgi:hypothetical protein